MSEYQNQWATNRELFSKDNKKIIVSLLSIYTVQHRYATSLAWFYVIWESQRVFCLTPTFLHDPFKMALRSQAVTLIRDHKVSNGACFREWTKTFKENNFIKATLYSKVHKSAFIPSSKQGVKVHCSWNVINWPWDWSQVR